MPEDATNPAIPPVAAPTAAPFAPVRGCSGSGAHGRTGSSGFEIPCAFAGPRLDFTFLGLSWPDAEITGNAGNFRHDRQTAVTRVDVVESQPQARTSG
jgi:hypothetical protein